MFLDGNVQENFLEKYNITPEQFRSALLDWKVLDQIAQDYRQREVEHRNVMDKYLAIINSCTYVHSLRSRRKEVEHLIEKIIRKNSLYMEKGCSISCDNYREYITDLMGIRILILFKEDWIGIDDFLRANFKFIEEPFVYLKEGDDEKIYKGRIKIKIDKEKSYRSAHYVIRDHCGSCIEIQVRTLNEEAWSEVDHKLRYPYNMKNEMLGNYIAIMSRLTGAADEMGTFINHYIRCFEKARRGGVLETNVVYAYILKELEKCSDIEAKENIEHKIKQACDYRELVQISNTISEIMGKL